MKGENQSRKKMGQKDCFGSLREISLNHSQTTTQAKPECRNCEEIRDCLRYSKQLAEAEKEKDELRKQNIIAHTIDHSHITSNEIGSCLLEFLSRLYGSPIGSALFKNLFLFHEVPLNFISSSLSIPISQKMIEMIQGNQTELDVSSFPSVSPQRGGAERFILQIVLFQRSFPKNPKANMGMIASEVARAVASNDLVAKQILQILPESEMNLFKKMDIDFRTHWLIEKWGFLEESEALKKELATIK